jgi:hypothetical protein
MYIARSTTICAGVAPRLSTIAPNRFYRAATESACPSRSSLPPR